MNILLPSAPMNWLLTWFLSDSLKNFWQITLRYVGFWILIHPSLFVMGTLEGPESADSWWIILGPGSNCCEEKFLEPFANLSSLILFEFLDSIFGFWVENGLANPLAWSFIWSFITRMRIKLEHSSHCSVLLPQADSCSSSCDTIQSTSQNSQARVLPKHSFS